MFVAQHSARSRFVRTAFLAAGLLPCAALLSWASWRHSWGHREALRRSIEGHLGVGLSIGNVEHLRPGCVRLRDVVVHEKGSGAGIGIPCLDADVAAGEVRLRAMVVNSTPAAVAMLASLGRAWLEQPLRFERNVVVEVDELRVASGPRSTAVDGGIAPWDGGGVRVECVGTDGGRAIRIRTAPDSGDELVVRVLDDTPDGRSAVEVQGRSSRPLPVPLVAAVLDWPALARTCGAAATVSGSIDARSGADGWGGVIDAELARIDLSASTAGLSLRLDGEGALSIPEGRFAAGRLSRGRGRITGGPGSIARESLAMLVSIVGCQPGVAWKTIERGGEVRFDRLSADFSIAPDGVTLAADADAGLIRIPGGALLTAPPGPVGIDRIAQALSHAALAAVPATPTSAWLLSTIPLPPPSTSGDTTAPPDAGALPPSSAEPARFRGVPHAIGGAPRTEGPPPSSTRR